MSDPPLSALGPDDPENLLSLEARRRISRALIVAERIRAEAFSAIETRYRAEPPGSVDFMGYLSTGNSFIELTESRMLAARTVLRVEEEEYRKLNLPGPQYRQIMREKIEGTVYSLELTVLQGNTLELEFVWGASLQREGELNPHGGKTVPAAEPDFEVNEPRPAITKSFGRPPGMISASGVHKVKDYVDRLEGGQEKLARMAGVEAKTIQRLLAGDPISRKTWIKLARAMKVTYEDLVES